MIKFLSMWSLIVTMLLGVATQQWYSTDNELVLANAAIEEQEKASEYYKEEVERQSSRYSALMRNRAKLQETVHAQQVEIDQYMGREATVYAKPGLVERLEKRAMDKFFKEIESDDD